MDMTGHNSGTAAHQLNAAIAGLGLALQDARTIRSDDRKQMVIVARHLAAVDAATADNEALSDAQIKVAGIIQATDLIANAGERSYARWLARGGVLYNEYEKKPNEINDLEAGSLNPIEARFLTGRKFAKTTTYTSIYAVILRECKAEIRKALDNGEGAPTMKDVTDAFGGFFKDETIVGWIAEETEKRSADYQEVQTIKKAIAMVADQMRHDKKLRARVRAAFEAEIKAIDKIEAQERADRVVKLAAKESAANLTAHQRRTIQDGMKRSQESDISQEVTDEDF